MYQTVCVPAINWNPVKLHIILTPAPVNEDLRLPCAAPNFFPQPKNHIVIFFGSIFQIFLKFHLTKSHRGSLRLGQPIRFDLARRVIFSYQDWPKVNWIAQAMAIWWRGTLCVFLEKWDEIGESDKGISVYFQVLIGSMMWVCVDLNGIVVSFLLVLIICVYKHMSMNIVGIVV